MRRRWRIVLVDEFQDTDPVQWQVLDRAFTGHATMVLIGDPKQAIYAFRGGDVVTYLAAAATATTRATLGTNWRSDAALVERLQVVLRGRGARRPPDRGPRRHRAPRRHSRLVGAPSPVAVPAPAGRAATACRSARRPGRDAGDAREHVARRLRRRHRALLASGATWDGAPLAGRRRRGPRRASATHGELVAARRWPTRGVPAVVAGGGHVFLTPAADDWLALLEALEQPHRSARVRAAALTAFFGRRPPASSTPAATT